MKHTTLYRKWRPRKFGEISGQEAVVRTLRRAIETDRVSHAYLFSGPRGTGKTSSAKVLAMGLNCQNSDSPTPEPCGECESCRGVLNNSSLDIVEMDAASNRGIDEIRDLRDRVNLAPASGRFKVYIIDEVHMLTEPAFNALLKTLEEPPERVVFILATTDKHKVPATIISRCQSFEFRRPGVDVLAGKLGEIAAAEGIDVEEEALTVIARAGGGSFRDAEGLLDQLSSFSDGTVTPAMVRELLGSAGPQAMTEVADALAEHRAADALRVLDGLSSEGRDLGQFSQELVAHLRNLMLLPHAPEVALAEVGSDEKDALEEQSQRIPTAEVVRTIEALGDATGRIRRGGDARMELELCFMKLARDYTEPSIESLMSRLEAIENAASNGAVNPATPSTPSTPSTPPIPPTPAVRSRQAASEPQPEPETPEEPESTEEPSPEREETKEAEGEKSGVADIGGRWSGVMQELKRRRQALTAAVYGEAKVAGFDGQVLTLSYDPGQSEHIVKMASDKKHVGNLGDILSDHFGVKPRIEVKAGGSRSRTGTSPAESSPASADDLPPLQEEPPGEAPDHPPEEPTEELPEAPPGDGYTARGRGPSPLPPPPSDTEDTGDGGFGAGSESSGGAEARSKASEGNGSQDGGDGIIRDQQEVFRMAQEYFGPSSQGEVSWPKEAT